MKTRSTPASLLFKGQATKHITGKMVLVLSYDVHQYVSIGQRTIRHKTEFIGKGYFTTLSRIHLSLLP